MYVWLTYYLRIWFFRRFIQSDPNFANFLYDDPKRTINLIDFGAARAYSKEFVDGYMKLVWAAANEDKQTILEVSQVLGFITGDETPEFTRGKPFLNLDFVFFRLTLTDVCMCMYHVSDSFYVFVNLCCHILQRTLRLG